MEEPKRFVVGKICLASDGSYHLHWYGAHPDQGGITERWGSAGAKDLESVGDLVSAFMPRNDSLYKEKMENILAKEKEEKDGESTPQGT